MTRSGKHISVLYRGPQGEGRDDFTDFVPMGLFNVLKALLLAGYEARLFNLSGVRAGDLAEAIGETKGDAVLISAFYGAHGEAFALARAARRALPGAPVILGGPLSALGPEILARIPEIDYVIRGEGEESAVDLLDQLLLGAGQGRPVSGLIRRNGKGVDAAPVMLLEDIDRFFFLPSELMDRCHGVSPDNFAILISSRGCPYRCAFCSSSSLWRNRLRNHRVELLVDYLRDLRRTAGAVYFSLRDENFLARPEHVRAFAHTLNETGLHYFWNAQASAHLVTPELAGILAGAGCDQLQMGVETVSPRLQALLGKKNDPAVIRRAAATLRSRAIRPFGYFIYGMGETDAEAKENTAFIRSCGVLDAVASPLVLYPGAPLAEGVDPALFFTDREIFLYDQESRRQRRPAYEAAVARVAGQGGFRREELFRAGQANAVTLAARHFYWLVREEYGKAEGELRELMGQQPGNPWGFRLLAMLYEDLGRQGEAAAMERKAKALISGKDVR